MARGFYGADFIYIQISLIISGSHVWHYAMDPCIQTGLPGIQYLTEPSVFWYKVRLTISLKTRQMKVRYFIWYSF